MRSELACSCLLGTLLLFTTSAPGNFDIRETPASPTVEIDAPAESVAVEAADAAVEASEVAVKGRNEPLGDDETGTAGGPRKPSALERARAALAQSDAPALSRNEICTTLLEVAQANQLPVGFFTNLIWQESRFDHTAISRVGAMGIAQFMPDVADTLSLDAFDPRDALPASGRLLRTLRARFGNLGLVAAAYNAGPKRVADWLEQRGGLPKETRDYVQVITGRAAEEWRNARARAVVFDVPRQVPCHGTAAFAAAAQAERAAQLHRLAEQQRLAEASRLASLRTAKKAGRRVLLSRVAPSRALRIARAP
jgi:hypothetical protein